MEKIFTHKTTVKETINYTRIILYLCLFVFFFVWFSLLLSMTAQAASLSFSPSSGSYFVGQTFPLEVYVSSPEQSMNAISGVISFPKDKLEVASVSKTGSIIDLWVQEPAFSNTAGTITFEGIVLNPGFTGSVGKIITINFRTKLVGSASLIFSSGSVLANDGKGTNILSNLNGGVYVLEPKSEKSVSPVSTGTPAAPVIFSSTHLDENEWYSNNDPEFTWELPSDVTGMSLLLNQSSTTNPGKVSEGVMESKKYEDVEDGAWYFHIRFRNQYGWGEILHRKVLIDTVPPNIFKIIVDKKGDLTNPSPVLYFESADDTSGIKYYEVEIDREKRIIAALEPAAIVDIRKNPFQMPLLTPGTHEVEVKAFDQAENFSLTETDIEITPIETPEITKIPLSVGAGDILKIEGKALPGVTVRIYLQKGGEEPILEKVKTDSEGNFVLSYDKMLPKGDYLVWAQAEDEKGALSNSTKKYSLEAGLPPLLKFGKIAIDYLTVIITLVILIIGALVVIFYGWYRISLWRKKVRTETKEVSQAVNGAFWALREEVQGQIEYLDGKPGLTKAESKVRDKLKEALDISEEFVCREIKDIEKELK